MSDFDEIIELLNKYVFTAESFSTITVAIVGGIALFRTFYPRIFNTFNAATQTEISLKSYDVFCHNCERCEECVTTKDELKPLTLVNLDDCYPMTSNPRGVCVIINNINFKDKHEKRQGSQVDEKNLRKIFEYLGFDVKVYVDVDKHTAYNIIAKQSTQSDLRKHDAFVLIVMSHGDENGIVLTDSSYITIKDLITPFNTEKCPALIGKPKLFFFQACRGSFKGYESDEETFLDGLGRRSKNKNNFPLFTDMFLSFSTIKGFISHRHTVLGSWYCNALFKALKENASTTDFISIINEVNRLIMNEQTQDGQKQSTSLQLLGVTKKLYFNPLAVNK